jgi:hypothetical protein
MSKRLRLLLTMACDAIEHKLPHAGHYWLCQALGQANTEGNTKVRCCVMRALSMVRRIEAS